MSVARTLCRLRLPLQSLRNVCTTRLVKNAYEGPGKTTVTFISKEIGPRLLVSNYDRDGFTLNTGAKVLGPMVLFSRCAFAWNVASGRDINEETLSLFTVLEPKLDVVVIGLDDRYDFEYFRNLQQLTKRLDLTAEIVSVHQACTAFNFMNEEGRHIAAALIPPKEIVRLSEMLPKSESKEQITDSGVADVKLKVKRVDQSTVK